MRELATYNISIIPIDKLSSFLDGVPNTPWTTSNHATDGGLWNWATPRTISYNGDDVVHATIIDNDSDPDHLNDDSWWKEGKSLQTIQNAIGYASPGDAIADEYEVNFTAMVDGVQKTYTLVALTAFKAADSRPDAHTFIGFTFDGEWPPSGAELTYVPNSNVDSETISIIEQEVAPCFVSGTMIETAHGAVVIDSLAVGDQVWTKDNGLQSVKWIGNSRLSARALAAQPELHPIRIQVGALGNNTPTSDLLVSPQHRILVRSKVAQKLFATDEVLVAAKQLLQVQGIDIAKDLTEVEYFHILFDNHEVVLSNGAETESLYTGPEALRLVGPAARAEIFKLFPELADRDYTTPPARQLLSGRQARKLAVRHVQHNRPLIM